MVFGDDSEGDFYCLETFDDYDPYAWVSFDFEIKYNVIRIDFLPWDDQYSSNVSIANVNISIGDHFCARTPRED